MELSDASERFPFIDINEIVVFAFVSLVAIQDDRRRVFGGIVSR